MGSTRRIRAGEPIIVAMSQAPSGPLTVSIESASEPIVGHVYADGQPERPFTGWIALVAALDEAIRTLRQEEEVDE